jgi:hypothetical protein
MAAGMKRVQAVLGWVATHASGSLPFEELRAGESYVCVVLGNHRTQLADLVFVSDVDWVIETCLHRDVPVHTARPRFSSADAVHNT